VGRKFSHTKLCDSFTASTMGAVPVQSGRVTVLGRLWACLLTNRKGSDTDYAETYETPEENGQGKNVGMGAALFNR
jgi:hypothetical protein